MVRIFDNKNKGQLFKLFYRELLCGLGDLSSFDGLIIHLGRCYAGIRSLTCKNSPKFTQTGWREASYIISHKDVIEIKLILTKRLPIVAHDANTMGVNKTELFMFNPLCLNVDPGIMSESICFAKVQWEGLKADDIELKLTDQISNSDKICDINTSFKYEEFLKALTSHGDQTGLSRDQDSIIKRLIERKLSPIIRIYNNEVVFESVEDSISIKLITDLVWIKELEESISDWNRQSILTGFPFTGIEPKKIRRFDASLLMIKYRLETDWLKEFIQCGMLFPTKKFSLFEHGVSLLFPRKANEDQHENYFLNEFSIFKELKTEALQSSADANNAQGLHKEIKENVVWSGSTYYTWTYGSFSLGIISCIGLIEKRGRLKLVFHFMGAVSISCLIYASYCNEYKNNSDFDMSTERNHRVLIQALFVISVSILHFCEIIF